MVAIGLMIMVPILLVAAAFAAAAMRWLRLLPDGVGPGPASFLLAATACGLLLLGDTYGALIARPAEVQKRFLGRVVAGPLRLRAFDEFGFQDPGETWSYDLSPAALAALRRRCRPDPIATGRCSLGGTMDDRFYASLGLDGDRLRVDKGFW